MFFRIFVFHFFFFLITSLAYSATQRAVFVYWSAEAQGLSVDVNAVGELRRLANKETNPNAENITTVIYFDPFFEDIDKSKTPVREVYVDGVFKSDLSERYTDEKNFGDGSFLKEALQFFTQFEGQQRIILFAGHGSSWFPKGGKEYDEISWMDVDPLQKLLMAMIEPVSFGYDQGNKPEDNITVFELKDAFLSLPEEKRKVDLIWYYTCLMNNLEYLYETRDFSNYVLAGDASLESAIELSPLFTNNSLDTVMLAKDIAQTNFIGRKPDQTNYILTDLSQIESLVQSVKGLSASVIALGESGGINSKDLERLHAESKIFNPLWSDSADYDVDLYRFLSGLKTISQASPELLAMIESSAVALKNVVIYSPYTDFQSLVKEMREWMAQNGDVTQEVLDQWLKDSRLGRYRDVYLGNLSAQVFNERIVGNEPFNSAFKYTNNNDETFDLGHEFRKHLRGEFKPKEYLSFFYPSDDKVNAADKKLNFGNEIELKALPFYKKLSFSIITDWWQVIEKRLPKNKIHWLKEFKGSNEDRTKEEDRRKFHDQGL